MTERHVFEGTSENNRGQTSGLVDSALSDAAQGRAAFWRATTAYRDSRELTMTPGDAFAMVQLKTEVSNKPANFASQQEGFKLWTYQNVRARS